MHASGPVIGVAGHEVLVCMLQALPKPEKFQLNVSLLFVYFVHYYSQYWYI